MVILYVKQTSCIKIVLVLTDHQIQGLGCDQKWKKGGFVHFYKILWVLIKLKTPSTYFLITFPRRGPGALLDPIRGAFSQEVGYREVG